MNKKAKAKARALPFIDVLLVYNSDLNLENVLSGWSKSCIDHIRSSGKKSIINLDYKSLFDLIENKIGSQEVYSKLHESQGSFERIVNYKRYASCNIEHVVRFKFIPFHSNSNRLRGYSADYIIVDRDLHIDSEASNILQSSVKPKNKWFIPPVIDAIKKSIFSEFMTFVDNNNRREFTHLNTNIIYER